MVKRQPLSLVARLLGLAASVLALVNCASNAAPDQWTLWYIPNEPTIVVPLSRECHTFIFASGPADSKTYRVVIMKNVVGKLSNDHAYFHSGDRFTGSLELGPATLHDVSAGYDVNVDSVYRIVSYLAAKARADADCPPPKHQTAPAASPKPQPSSSVH